MILTLEKQTMPHKTIALWVTFFLLQWQNLSAQPSGGPYGPIPQKYELPSAGRIHFVSTEGKTNNDGSTIERPITIEAAIERATTGDVIVLRGGVYRTGNLLLNQGITLQPYKDEQVVFKGTLVAANWENLGNGLWRTRWTRLFPARPADWWRREREGKRTPLYRFNNDMVFADGKFLQAVGWEGEVNEGTYYIDYENNYVYIGIDPSSHEIEITAFDVAILRTTKECHGRKSDGRGYTLRGITFTQYAYRALEIEGKDPEGLSSEKDHGKDVIGTTIEHCTISYCSRVGGYFRGDSLVIRHCKISDTSTEGVYILSSNDVLLEKNIFTRNNIELITGYFPAAVKIFNQCYRVTCNDNLVIDLPYSNGIWYDVGNVDGVFINNWIENVGNNQPPIRTDQLWPSDNGFFFEISKGVICAGNVFVNCDHGLMILNSSNAQIYNNTFVNSMACIGRNARTAAGDHFGWHPSTGPAIEQREGHVFVNNLLVATEETVHRPLLFVWQVPSLCMQLTNSQVKEMHHNVFAYSSLHTMPLILWGPSQQPQCQASFTTLSEFRKHYPQFAENTKEIVGMPKNLFQSYELKNFHLLPFTGTLFQTAKIPNTIRAVLLKKYEQLPPMGAFPIVIK